MGELGTPRSLLCLSFVCTLLASCADEGTTKLEDKATSFFKLKSVEAEYAWLTEAPEGPNQVLAKLSHVMSATDAARKLKAASPQQFPIWSVETMWRLYRLAQPDSRFVSLTGALFEEPRSTHTKRAQGREDFEEIWNAYWHCGDNAGAVAHTHLHEAALTRFRERGDDLFLAWDAYFMLTASLDELMRKPPGSTASTSARKQYNSQLTRLRRAREGVTRLLVAWTLRAHGTGDASFRARRYAETVSGARPSDIRRLSFPSLVSVDGSYVPQGSEALPSAALLMHLGNAIDLVRRSYAPKCVTEKGPRLAALASMGSGIGALWWWKGQSYVAARWGPETAALLQYLAIGGAGFVVQRWPKEWQSVRGMLDRLNPSR